MANVIIANNIKAAVGLKNVVANIFFMKQGVNPLYI